MISTKIKAKGLRMDVAQEERRVHKFSTSQEASIFQIPLEVFPGFWAYAYLVLVEDQQIGEMRVLIDTGSGFGDSNEHLDRGLKQASEMLGRSIDLADLTHIFITHGHIDHFGGLSYVRPRTQALLGVHELDRRILTNYEERLTIVSRHLEEFLLEAGVSPERVGNLLNLYKITKELFRSVVVDFTYEAVGMHIGPFILLHVPGHCAGHVVIRLHDVLFSGDHVLNDISPHQAPENLTLSTGLEHYLHSLEILRTWSGQIRLTLGGHKNPITDLDARISSIQGLHFNRLNQVLEFLDKPHSVKEVSIELFGEVQGYNVLLALEEAGAHVEYLYNRGMLGVENLAELEQNDSITTIFYRRLAGDGFLKLDQEFGKGTVPPNQG
jgi:glyoxylase-like metal-dependent hydrolase (beta-lactamase superfamily II)